MNNSLLVISHYNSRPKDQLKKLIEVTNHLAVDRLIVINDDNCKENNLKKESNNLFFLVRPNIGMNIGGWNDAFFCLPNYAYYIFIQDECLILNKDFLMLYQDLLSNKNVGMIGESMNPKWDKTWETLLNSPLNYSDKDHVIKGVQIPRVCFYLELFKKWGISPGIKATHLRSLIWAFKNEILHRINGFPLGLNKGECIASEIAVSKKIEALELQIKQVDSAPFKYIHHTEWNKDGFSKL
jgi:hypothetical protein